MTRSTITGLSRKMCLPFYFKVQTTTVFLFPYRPSMFSTPVLGGSFLSRTRLCQNRSNRMFCVLIIAVLFWHSDQCLQAMTYFCKRPHCSFVNDLSRARACVCVGNVWACPSVSVSLCQRAPGSGRVTQFTVSVISCQKPLMDARCLERLGTNRADGDFRRKLTSKVTDRESQT